MVLSSLTMLGLIQPILVVYVVVFFVITYITLGALMAAIGAAVNEMREAQSLMTPITLMIMIPWLFAAPIARNPSSTFATVISFLPPINTFAMLIRVTSSAPPPAWQVWLTVALSMVRGAGRSVVRGQGVQGGPADVRQAARPEDAGAVGADGLTGKFPTPNACRFPNSQRE